MNGRVFIMGGDGFVGSAYVRFCLEKGIDHCVITRENYSSLKGERCALFINANGNSKKFLANNNPLEDYDASVKSVVASLYDFKFERYVFLSSAEVYPEPTIPVAVETLKIDPAALSIYGRHKYFAESYVRAFGCPYLIIRQSGFVGPNLKKNAIFDMLHGDPLWVSLDSQLQFNSTDQSASQVMHLVHKQVEDGIYNVSAPGMLRIGDIYEKLQSRSLIKRDVTKIENGLPLEKISKIDGMPLTASHEIMADFLDEYSSLI